MLHTLKGEQLCSAVVMGVGAAGKAEEMEWGLVWAEFLC